MLQYFYPAREHLYDVSDESEYPDFNGISLRDGTRKSTQNPVSVFHYDKTRGTNDQCEYAKAMLKRLKTIRHPNILTYLDSQEDDSALMIITECVKPLHYYLLSIEDENHKRFYISWGLMNICKAISFLNQDAKIIHGEVSINAVYVNNAGEWKLGNVGKATNIDGTKSPNDSSACDSLGLGTLIWEVYNSMKCDSPSQLHNISKVPGPIKRTVQDLVSPINSKRPSAATVLERGRKVGSYFQNDLVDAIVFLDEIHIKNKEEVNLFFKNFQPLLNDVPKPTAEYKILPQLIKACEYFREGTCILPALFQITSHVSDSSFENDVVPFLIKIFNSADRATRSLLLQHLEVYIDKIPPAVVNDCLFRHILNGLLDTNPRIREQTVKAMIHVAPKLNEQNLNTELMKHFAQLLAKDDQGGIRTNIIVCIAKIGYSLSPQNRRTILMSAFLRSLNDPFPPVRNAGTLGLAVSQQYFALEDVSKRILPALCGLTVDPDASVRESVFKTIKGFLSNLEKVSDNPELKTQMEAESLSLKKPSSSWAEWATTAITSKLNLKMDRKPKQVNPEKSKDANKSSGKTDIDKIPPSQVPAKLIDSEKNISTSEIIAPESISDKMKYMAVGGDDEFNWDGDSWETPDEDMWREKETPVTIVAKTTREKKSNNRTDEERRKPRSGPMKLGTRLNQPKLD